MKVNIEVRVPYHLVTTLTDGVAFRSGHESVVFALVGSARVGGRYLLTVRSIHQLPEEAYVNDPRHGAKWSGASMLPILNQALEQKLGVLMLHTHGGGGLSDLSDDDRQSADRLLPTFENLIPERPHGSIVFNENTVAGVFLLPGGETAGRLKIRLFRNAIHDLHDYPPTFPKFDDDHESHRQALLTGGAGEWALKNAVLAVVGLSGGGSHIVQQAAYMGIGTIIGIDSDRCERSNRRRLIGMTALDALLHRRKIAVMRRMVRRIDRRITFIGVAEDVPAERALRAIKEADVIVGSVDNYHARADLQDLALRYAIPYVDIGLLIRPHGGDVVIGGNVITAIPGRFCQWCFGFLSQKNLDLETGGRPRSYFQGTDKQAQVVSMNGVLASEAMTEVLQLLTGFGTNQLGAVIKKYDGVRGTLVELEIGERLCDRCRSLISAGDPVWSAV
jgi:molybdopterin-synthase adenylyltransferase